MTDPGKRPESASFQPHLGTTVAVRSLEEKNAGVAEDWTFTDLVIGRPIKLPGHGELECFHLLFRSPAHRPQGLYEFRFGNDETTRLVAIPTMGNDGKPAMQVVIC